MNDQFIQIKNSVKKTKTIMWKNIKEIHIKPIAIEYHLNDDSIKNLSLGSVGYKYVLEIKEKIADFANSKEIIIS